MKRAKTELDYGAYLAWPAYPFAALLVIQPLMDLVFTVWPLRPGAITWRFGSVGLLSAALITPMIGDFFAVVAANVLGHRRVQWFLTSANALLSVLMSVILVLFVLDAVQLRSQVIPEAMLAYDVAMTKTFVIQSIALTVFVALSFTGFRTLWSNRPAKVRGEVPLVAGPNEAVRQRPEPRPPKGGPIC